jgi:hypothetical protein
MNGDTVSVEQTTQGNRAGKDTSRNLLTADWRFQELHSSTHPMHPLNVQNLRINEPLKTRFNPQQICLLPADIRPRSHIEVMHGVTVRLSECSPPA